MQLSDVQVSRFQALYATRFGEELTRAEALEMGTKLVRLMQLVYKPMTQEEYIRATDRQQIGS